MSDPSNARGRCARSPPAPKKTLCNLRSRRYREVKFCRRHSDGPYVADFACVGARLVFEVDGPSHGGAEQAAFDAKRSADLESWGWRVARIANADVYAGGDGLYELLDRALNAPAPPREGEGVGEADG